MDHSGLGESFFGAVQASLSVVLVIVCGGIAAHLQLLDAKSAKAISKVSVRMFLPALLITKIGSELHADCVGYYGIVLVWAVACHVVSFALGSLARVLFGMPDWITVAVMFNNTTSYPLLLLAALHETGVLDTLIGKDETASDAIEHASTYFLIFATVSSCITFAVGPRLVDTEHPPDEDLMDNEDADGETYCQPDPNEETGLLNAQTMNGSANRYHQHSFFPSRKDFGPQAHSVAERKVCLFRHRLWTRLSPRIRWWLVFVSDFFNSALVGAIIGAIIGLSPTLQRAFFSPVSEGGIFTAWLTAALKKIGGLFVPLPVVVAGVSLYCSVNEARRQSLDGWKLPWPPVIFIVIVRFVMWPVVSIATIYLLASKTSVLGSDPILWFAMMLMPTGPPATKLIAMIQVSNADEEEESSIAKILTFCYIISPVLSFTVVGALETSRACIR